MLCNGNLSEFCGGPNRIDVYDFNNTVKLPPWTTTVTASATTTTTTTTTAKVSSSASVSVSSVRTTTTTKAATTTTTTPSVIKSSTTTSTNPSVSATTKATTTSIVHPPTTTTTSPSATPTLGIKQTVGAYSFIGCYTEATNGRALTGANPLYDYTAMTLEECGTYCSASSFTYFGVEYGGECKC